MTWDDDGPVCVEPTEPFTHMQGMCVALLVHDRDFAQIAKQPLISPLTVKDHIEIVPVSHVDEVLARAMTQKMQPIEWTEADEHAAEPRVPGHSSEGEAPLRH